MTPNYYYRNVSKAMELQREIHAIHEVMEDAFDIAREVAGHKLTQIKGKNPDIIFKLDKLFLQYILDNDANGISARTTGGLTEKNFNNLKAFFDNIDLSSVCFHNPQTFKDSQKEIETVKVAGPLQIAYRIHTKRFIKIELPSYLQEASCFDYAIRVAGFKLNELAQFWLSTNRSFSFWIHLEFLKTKGMVQGTLPLQPKDIIVYFNKEGNIIHAAYVTENNSKLVYSKFGNNLPFAYLHYEVETPPQYGDKFQIYRLHDKGTQSQKA